MLGAATAVLLALLAAAPASTSQAPTAATPPRPQPGLVPSRALGATHPGAITFAQTAPLRPVDALPLPSPKDLQDPTQCHSYGRSRAQQQQADKAWKRADAQLNTILTIARKPEAKALYDQYMMHGVMSAARQEVTDPAALAEFAASPQTSQAYQDVQTAARKVVLARPNLNLSAAGTLHDLGVGQGLTINWPLPAGNPLKAVSSTPGLIAGGTGSLIGQRGNYQDRRVIDGVWSIVPVFAPNGDLVKVVLRLSDVTLLVQDSIDFCPGAIGGPTSAARQLLLPLSRLERTPWQSGGGFTQPVLWQAHVALPSVDMDVSPVFLHRFPSEIHAKIVITSVNPLWDQDFASGTVTADYVPVPGACPQGQAVRAPCEYQLKDPQASSGFMVLNDTVDQCYGATGMPPWATAAPAPSGTIVFRDYVTAGTFTSVYMNFGGSADVPITCADGGGGSVDATFTAETDQNGGTWSLGLHRMHFDIDSEVSRDEGTIDLTFTY